MGNISGFPKEQSWLLTKKEPKSIGYLNLPSKFFCRYSLIPRSLCDIWIVVVQGM